MKKSIQTTGSIFANLALLALLTACPSEKNDNNDMSIDRTETMQHSQSSQHQDAQDMTNPSLSNQNATSQNTNNQNSNSSAPEQATVFLTKALQGGSTEVQMGKLALDKSQNAEVKNFAQHLIKDHSQAGENVKKLAGAKQLPLPTQISSNQQSQLTHLASLSGAEFDKEFMALNVQIHEKDVAEFQNQASSNPDHEVRALAANTLPKLQTHLKMAKDLNSKVNK